MKDIIKKIKNKLTDRGMGLSVGILLAVMGFMVLFGKISSNYIKLGQLDREIEAIQQQITDLDAESDEIREILDEENHDEYFEKIAREKYGYCKPGEKQCAGGRIIIV